jgi:exopolysaccharide biosynthesis polyprenyl glycosylphosphotransferase
MSVARLDIEKAQKSPETIRGTGGQAVRRRIYAFGIAFFDMVCILGAYLVAVFQTHSALESFGGAALVRSPYFVIFVIMWFAAAVDQRLFGPRRNEDTASYLLTVTKTVANATVVSVFVMALFTQSGVERDFLVLFCLLTLGFMLALRATTRLLFWVLPRGGAIRVLIVGANNRTRHLVRVLEESPHGYELVGFLEDEPERAESFSIADLPHLGGLSDLSEILHARGVHEVFISLPVRSHYATITHIAETCERQEISARLLADLFPLHIAKSRLMYLIDIPLLSLSAVPEAQSRLALKRAVDFVVSSILLILLAPLFLLLAIVIKLDTRGPVFFLQERVGQNQRRFKMMKFRSMVPDAEHRRGELEAMNEADGPVFKIRMDPRITRVGRFIRKYSVDEFPQLINVWLGEMSLVGPRPPLASEVAQYSWSQRRRLSVKPGMTGLWQVSGRSDVGFSEWVDMDLTYIDTWSLWKDFVILVKTFRAVVEGRGAA